MESQASSSFWKRNIVNQFSETKGQSKNLILDLQRSPLSNNRVIEDVKPKLKDDDTGIVEVIIIVNEFMRKYKL